MQHNSGIFLFYFVISVANANDVTITQLLEFGQLPWRTKPAIELTKSLEMGERLPKPKTCTLEVYALMLRCESHLFSIISSMWQKVDSCKNSIEKLIDKNFNL